MRLISLLALLAGAVHAPALWAVTCTTLTTGGNWGTAANWTCTAGGAHVPLAGEDVVVNRNFTVDIATNSVASLTVSAGTLTQNAGLTIQAGGALNVAGGTLTSNSTIGAGGPTNVSAGTFTPSSSSSRIFTGLVTVSGGTWNGGANNRAATFQGGINVTGGTFTPGTGTMTFNTSNQDINGSIAIAIPSVAVAAGITLTNKVATGTGLTVSTTLGATGTLDNQGVLNVGFAGPPGLTLTATTVGNTVNYSRANTQTIKNTTYHHLTLSNTSAKTAGGALTVNGDFTITGTATFNGGTSLTHSFAGNWVVNTTAATPFAFTTTSILNFNTPATPAQTSIGGSTVATLAFNDVNINNTSGVVFNDNASFSTGTTPALTVASGALVSAAPTVVISGTGTLTGPGAGNGTVQVTRTGADAFLTQYTITTKTLTNLTVEYAGAAAQTVSNTTYSGGMKVNNASGVSLAANTTVGGTLTLASGNLTATGFTLITSAACNAPSVSRTSGHVIGNLQKAIPAGASSCTFEVGSGTNFTPVVLDFVAGTTAGNMIASTTGSEHPNIATSSIVSTKSVNRYWTLTNGGVGLPGAGYSATFNYINGSPVDFDAGANTAGFIVQRFSAGAWSATTVNGSCTSTPGANLCAQSISLAAFGDFAIGETTFTAGNSGWFNVFESTTAANSISGRIFTKIVGTAFNLDVVAINAARTGVKPGFSSNPITVELLDASDNSGAVAAETDCRASWVSLSPAQSFSLSPAWASSRGTVTIPAQATALRELRIKVTQGSLVGCSTDNFSIRPGDFAISSSNAIQTNSSGSPTIKAGSAAFNLTATAAPGYNGTPAFDQTKVVGTPTAGTVSGSFGAASAGTGIAVGNSFTYGEVGNFGLNANAVTDTTFTTVDQAGGDCTSDFSTTLTGGKYGCSIGSAAVAQTTGSSGFGRFIPDHFALSSGAVTNRTDMSPACSPVSTFTYMGERLDLSFTLTAQNASNATTQNYAGAYAKLDVATFANLGLGARSGTTNLTSRIDTGSTSSGTWTSGAANVTAVTGISRAASPDGPFSAIAFGIAPVDPDSVAMNTLDLDVDNNAANDHKTLGVSTEVRFGRLRLLNASGPPALALAVQIQTESWTGTGFQVNGLDGCTTLNRNNIVLESYAKNLNACETIVTATPVTFAGGVGSLRLTAPGVANDGSLTLKPQLGASASGNFCNTVGGSETATSAALKSYLQGNWTGANYDQNPFARASFGVYGAQPRNFIFYRENY